MEFRKSGFGDEEAASLSRLAAMYQNVADTAVSAEDAAASITSQIRAYGVANEDAVAWAEHVINTYNEVANNFSVGTNDLSQAMEIASAGMATYGNSFDETVALVASGTEIMTGRGSQVARGLQTIASRIQKSTESLAAYGIATKNADGSMRSTYEVLKDLSEIWGTLSDTQRTVLGEELAGLNQYKVLTSVLQNFQTAIRAVTTAEQSHGSALKENAAYMDSLQAKTAEFRAAYEQLANSVVNSELVKLIIGAGTSVLKILNSDIGVAITQITLLSGVVTGGISLLSQFGKGLLAASANASILGKSLSALSTYALPAGVAIGVITTAVMTGISAWKEYDEVANGAVNTFNDTVDSANATLRKRNAETRVTIDVANDLVSQLDKLNKISSLNNTEQQRYSTIVEKLNTLIPDLNLSIDDTTHKLNTQTDAIREQINEWKNLDFHQAYATARQTTMKAYVELQADLELKKDQRKELIKKQQDLIKQYGEDISLYPDNFFAALIDPWTAKGKGRREYQALEDQIKAVDEGIRNAKQAIEENQKLYNGYVGQQEKYLAELNEKVGADTNTSAQQPGSKAIQFDYSSWLKEQQHALNTGKIQEADYYTYLQAMLDKYTDESIISTDERWKAEEDIYRYKQNLSKQQQKDYEQALKAAKAAAKEEYQTQKQSVQNVRSAFSAWQDEQDYLLTIGKITESEYYDNLRKKNEEYFAGKEEFLSEYWSNLEKIYKWESDQLEAQFDEWLKIQEHRLAMDEITEAEYYTELKKMNEQYFANNEKYLDKYWKNEEAWYKWKKQQIEDIRTATENALDAEIEKEKEKLQLKKTATETRKAELEAQQKELEQLSKYAQKIADEQISAIDDKISALKDEADAITEKYKDQIDALEQQNQAIDDQINKQKLLEALAKAQQTKKYVFKDGRFQYVSDVDAINEAQSQLDEFEREQALQTRTKQLEKQRDLEIEQNQLRQKALEEEKQRWQEYKNGWSNLTNAYEEEQNALLASQKLGIDIEKATWNERISNLDDFRRQYIDLAKQIKKAEAEISEYGTAIANVDSTEMRDAKIQAMMKANSAAWHATTDEAERERLHVANEYLNSLLSNQGTYNAASGKWSNLTYQSANSGLSAQSVLSSTPIIPTSQTSASSIIASGTKGIKQSGGQTINLGNVTLPSVTNAKQFVSELKNMALQAAYSRG